MVTGRKLPTAVLMVAFLVALPVAYLAVALAPAGADLDFIAFESCTLPDGSPCSRSGPGDAPAGATLKFRFFTDCPSVRIDWGDGGSQTATQPSRSINAATATHVYQRSGTYTVTGTDQCDFQTETNTVTIGGGGPLGLPIDLGNPSAIAAVLGIIGGAAILVTALAPLSSAAQMAAARGAGGIQRGLAGAPGTGYSVETGRYIGAVPETPPAATGSPVAGVPSPIQGGTGYSVGTGRYVGATPEAPPAAPPAPAAAVPPPIQFEGGQPMTGPGASVGAPSIGAVSVSATWQPGSVTLTWSPPQFDPGQNTLLGYNVSPVRYVPNSTMPVPQPPTFFPPGSGGATINFTQTHVYSTGGDLTGFRVDPVFTRFDGLRTVQFQAGGVFVPMGVTP